MRAVKLSDWTGLGTAAVVLALICAAARAQVGDDDKGTNRDPRAWQVLRVRESARTERFYVRDPDALRSPAWRDDLAQADKAERILEPTPGFELTDRVLVRTDRPARLARLARGFPVEPLPGVRGFWTVATGSVREAAWLADELATHGDLEDVSVDLARPVVLRTLPNDPQFPLQWHLKNDLDPLFDIDAETAWNMGYTGAGVVIGIVEGGWQYGHADLAPNFLPEATQEGGTAAAHGTSCAGLAAAVGNNNLMVVGVAYGAQLSAQIYGTDAEVATALTYRNDLNDIKSNSWGPLDIGQIDYMPAVVRTALEVSIAAGRGGLGEVFVWAAGNGAGSQDRVDYDPYASSRYTIAVGAVGDADTRPYYSEKGSSLVVVAPSDGNNRGITTTTAGNSWTTHFGGTSAACPIAAGVVGLMLEANPGLTWRDVQHVLIESTRQCDPNAATWTTNGAGRAISYQYGFGAVDAGAAVALAETWKNVPHEVNVDTGAIEVNSPIPDNDPNGVSVAITVVDDIRIETVELVLNVLTTKVGDLDVAITSPEGTRSLVAQQRITDGHNDYDDYLFTSFRHWGESSAGDWTVEIADLSGGNLATWTDFRLILHGTPICPGDLNGDGQISVTDLLDLLTVYGSCEGEAAYSPAADLVNNGCVDLSDLAEMLSRYGESCQ